MIRVADKHEAKERDAQDGEEDGPGSEREAADHHLAQASLLAPGGEKGDGERCEEVWQTRTHKS